MAQNVTEMSLGTTLRSGPRWRAYSTSLDPLAGFAAGLAKKMAREGERREREWGGKWEKA